MGVSLYQRKFGKIIQDHRADSCMPRNPSENDIVVERRQERIFLRASIYDTPKNDSVALLDCHCDHLRRKEHEAYLNNLTHPYPFQRPTNDHVWAIDKLWFGRGDYGGSHPESSCCGLDRILFVKVEFGLRNFRE